jgi:hypothetical protein
MGYASDTKIAGPLDIDAKVIERDALIREDNDGEVIDDFAVRSFVKNNKAEIFAQQSGFFADLRRKLGDISA